MRVLLVGSLPPPATERSRALLAEVLRLRRQGDSVEVLSPTRDTVAHRYLELGGPGAALEIALAARRADRVVVELRPGFPFEETGGRARRAVGLCALAAGLAAARADVTLRLHSIHDLPGGPGGRAADVLFKVADRVEAGDESTLAELSAVLGAEGRVLCLAAPPLPPPSKGEPDGRLAGDASVEAVTALVRARAAGERARLLGDPVEVDGPVRGSSRVPLWEWVPRPGAGIPQVVQASLTEPRASGARRIVRVALENAEAHPVTRPLALGARALRRAATGA